MNISSCNTLDPIIYTIISNKYATLKEIRDDYSIDEVISLYEACLVNVYNKHQVTNLIKEVKK